MIEPVGRPAGDILSRSVRLTLGDKQYVLPVLTIGGNRRWMEKLDAELTTVLSRLRRAGTRAPELYDVLAGQLDAMIDLLTAYDTTHVLPPRDEILEQTYEDELIAAVQEVWRTANPLVAMAVDRIRTREALTNASLAPTSSPPPSGAGPRKRSKKN